MRDVRLISVLAVFCMLAPAQTTPDVGSGAPNDFIRSMFAVAYYRNYFNTLVSLPPVGEVTKLGATGMWQLFNDAAKTSGVRYALVKPNASIISVPGTPDVLQMFPEIYVYFNSVGVSTAGYPKTDTLTCPTLPDGNACTYQFFNKNYALLVYSKSTFNGQNFYVRDPFYTRWVALGDLAGLGPPTAAEQTATSAGGVTATFQIYYNGALYNTTSGQFTGRLFPVLQPIYGLYAASGAHSGFLGLPMSEETTLADGRHRQSFEGGSIEYVAGSSPVLRPQVLSVVVTPNFVSLRMNLGDSVTLQAAPLGAGGSSLADRLVQWVSTNGRVLKIEPSSNTAAVVRAVGDGTAQVRAIAEGKSSPPLTILVTAPCCRLGQGAPNEIIRQAFQDAVTRNNLSLSVPGQDPVRRAGDGYVQEFAAADAASNARYLIAKPDRSPAAYFITGAILARYQELGGPSGTLGYPKADATAGGTQLFEKGALAGSPVQLVSGVMLAKWAAWGYETGPAGPPTGGATTFLTFTATAGQSQTFRGGAIYLAGTGPRAGKAFYAGGSVFARYTAWGGVAGSLGMPITDEFASSGRRRQEFEGGYIDYAPGDSQAQATERPRVPSVSVTPDSVVAGGRVRAAVGGFAQGGTLRVSITGQPDFVVATESGAYAWEIPLPADARSGTVTIRAVHAASGAAAQASYTVTALSDAAVAISKVGGDAQTGAPGATLAQKTRVALRDARGGPVPGAAIRFTPSPGGRADPASAVTDENGEAETAWRLPVSEGVALLLAEGPRQATPVTFSARMGASSLSNFPGFRQTDSAALGRGTATIAEKGALLAAAASILRYYQNRGDVPAPNGLADPGTLNQFLSGFCAVDSQGGQICDGFVSPFGSDEQIVNLWRLGAFAGNAADVTAEKPDPGTVRDLVAQGSPVLLALALSAGGNPAGSHFVVATGVAAGGAILIHDPNPKFGRGSLNEYLSGFDAGGKTWKAELVSALRVAARAPSPTGFLITGGGAAFELLSPAGPCGTTVGWPALPVSGPDMTGRDSPPFRARYCDGSAPLAQLDAGGEAGYRLAVTDLANPGMRAELSGTGAASYKIARPVTQWAVTPLSAGFEARGVVSAASYTPDLAPGGIFSIFGSGLARAGAATGVEIDGTPAAVLAAGAFQVNAQAPRELTPGAHTVRVRSPYGSAEQSVTFRETAPAVFLLGPGWAAIVNQDGSIQTPSSPARRGQVMVIYGTGFGAVTSSGAQQAVTSPVTALVQGRELAAAFAGLTPGFIGLYQVNLPVPADLPPGLGLPLILKQGPTSSQPVEVHIE